MPTLRGNSRKDYSLEQLITSPRPDHTVTRFQAQSKRLSTALERIHVILTEQVKASSNFAENSIVLVK